MRSIERAIDKSILERTGKSRLWNYARRAAVRGEKTRE